LSWARRTEADEIKTRYKSDKNSTASSIRLRSGHAPRRPTASFVFVLQNNIESDFLIPIFMGLLDELHALPRRTQSAGEEMANSISHGIGFIAALVATPVLLLVAFQRSSVGFFIGTVVFTSTMLLLYLGSTLYHAWPQTRVKSILRVFDHSAIFLLIAGTYTPFALGPLSRLGGSTMLGIVWGFAVFGIFMKATRGASRHSKLAMSLYLGMGWLIPITNHQLAFAIPLPALIWLLAGGVAYTTGVLFFANDRLRYSHFIWHLFVLAGSSCHFAAVCFCAG
jgi:hemolysin III